MDFLDQDSFPKHSLENLMLCDWRNSSLMTVRSDAELKRFVSLWPRAVFVSEPNALRRSCRSQGCKASTPTRKGGIRNSISTNLVTSTFRTAFRERGNPSSLTFHSDRGKQYTSATFTALLQKCGVKQSFSATARPHDNAVAETFFASFKKEEAYRREYTSEQSYRKSVEQYIRLYNELRPHRTMKYKTPHRQDNRCALVSSDSIMTTFSVQPIFLASRRSVWSFS